MEHSNPSTDGTNKNQDQSPPSLSDISDSLQQLDGQGWIRAELDKDEHTGSGCDIVDLAIFLPSQFEQDNESGYRHGMARPTDFPETVLGESDTVHLRFKEAGFEIERQSLSFGIDKLLCRNDTVYTDNSNLRRTMPADVYKTEDYFIFTKYHQLPAGGSMNVWVERNYEAGEETVLHQTEVEVRPESDTRRDTVTVSLVEHDEAVSYDFNADHRSIEARVQLVQETPIVALFEDYDDATAFYGLIREVGMVPDFEYHDESRHVISEGYFTTRIPLSISKLGKPAVATYIKTATALETVDTGRVAERMDIQTKQAIWNYLSDVRYDPLSETN